jgi:hypothetical protein
MEPATIGLVSAGVGAVGSLVSGFSQNAQAQQAAAVSDANAKIAQDQAAANAAAIANKAVRVKGSQEAAAGASGIQGSGFADAIKDSDIEAELDRQTALYNGRMQARNLKTQADNERESGRAAIVGGLFGAGTRALSGYGSWRYMNALSKNGTGSATPGLTFPTYGGAELFGTGSSY